MGLHETTSRHDQLLQQLNEERVSALVRISRALDALIDQLHEAGARVADARPDDREREMAAYRDVRQRTLRYRWYLEVQREALGLRHHQRLDEFYRIPPSIDA